MWPIEAATYSRENNGGLATVICQRKAENINRDKKKYVMERTSRKPKPQGQSRKAAMIDTYCIVMQLAKAAERIGRDDRMMWIMGEYSLKAANESK